ncbi:MAG: polysaccharide deacetylase family protein [Promethearchaeota archaeon]
MKIALTFDVERDIPHFLDSYSGVEIGLPKILNLLDDFKIKATFFCTGNVVQNFPESIKLLNAKGHEISCHSLNHERLNLLDFKTCEEVIHKNKDLIENLIEPLEVIGFRAPYLNPPIFIFKILTKLGFKYDSSIASIKNYKKFQNNNAKIQEFHPTNYYPYFRISMNKKSIKKKIVKRELIIPYFHVWEAIDMKNLILNLKGRLTLFKSILFRPDRWFNTGNSFITKLESFIEIAYSEDISFNTLNQLIKEK